MPQIRHSSGARGRAAVPVIFDPGRALRNHALS